MTYTKEEVESGSISLPLFAKQLFFPSTTLQKNNTKIDINEMKIFKASCMSMSNYVIFVRTPNLLSSDISLKYRIMKGEASSHNPTVEKEDGAAITETI